MSYTSIVSFCVNKTGDLQIMCLNGVGPYKVSSTVKVLLITCLLFLFKATCKIHMCSYNLDCVSLYSM